LSVSVIFEWVGALLILLGSIMAFLSAIGIIRFRDIYTRAHAATKTTTVAVLITLFGTFIYLWLGQGYLSVRLILGIVFVFLTAPVSGHLVLRAAYRSGVEMTEDAVKDELKPVLEKTTSEEG